MSAPAKARTPQGPPRAHEPPPPRGGRVVVAVVLALRRRELVPYRARG